MKPVPIRGYNNYDTEKASLEAGTDDGGMPSKTVQSQKDDADINVIVRRFGVTGELPLHQRIPLNVDVDEILDYRTCLDRVRAADAAFNSMPADVRARFDNNPAALVDFFEDPANREEGVRLGLIAGRQDDAQGGPSVSSSSPSTAASASSPGAVSGSPG